MSEKKTPAYLLTSEGKLLSRETCHVCGYSFNAATALEGDARPEPEDFTICINCGEIYQYNKELRIVPADPAVLLNLEIKKLLDPQLWKAQKLIRERGRFVVDGKRVKLPKSVDS